MLDPKQVIVYRNRSEQALDQLLWDNPEIMGWVALILIAVVIGALGVGAFRAFRRRKWH